MWYMLEDCGLADGWETGRNVIMPANGDIYSNFRAIP